MGIFFTCFIKEDFSAYFSFYTVFTTQPTRFSCFSRNSFPRRQHQRLAALCLLRPGKKLWFSPSPLPLAAMSRYGVVIRRCEWQMCGSLVSGWLKHLPVEATEWILVLDEHDWLVEWNNVCTVLNIPVFLGACKCSLPVRVETLLIFYLIHRNATAHLD